MKRWSARNAWRFLWRCWRLRGNVVQAMHFLESRVIVIVPLFHFLLKVVTKQSDEALIGSSEKQAIDGS